MATTNKLNKESLTKVSKRLNLNTNVDDLKNLMYVGFGSSQNEKLLKIRAELINNDPASLRNGKPIKPAQDYFIVKRELQEANERNRSLESKAETS